jgi:hypothetical protein
VSSVMPMVLWPRSSWTIFGFSPFPKSSVAAVWRKS